MTERGEAERETQTERVSGQPVDAKAELWQGGADEDGSARGSTDGERAEADATSDETKRSE